MKFFQKRSGIKTKVADDFEKVVVPKTDDEISTLQSIMSSSYLFESLDSIQLIRVVEVMKPVTFGSGKDVIRQGDKGNDLYILTHGQCEAWVDGVKVASYDRGIFGELALIYDAPRAATVRTTEFSQLYSLNVSSFRHVLSEQAQNREQERRECLEKVPLLKTLGNKKLTSLVKSLETVNFDDGQVIIRQGDEGDVFYIIESGMVAVSRNGRILTTMGRYECFGEMALMDNSPRHATVTAQGGAVICLALSRAMFVKLLGPLKGLLQAHTRHRVLRTIGLFKSLTDAECDDLVDAMVVEKFKSGTPIIKQGKKGTKFYVLQTGSEAVVEKDGVEVGRLHNNDYFGEAALINHVPRAATVTACGDVVCYTLERKKFEKLLMNTAGTAETFQREMQRRKSLTRKVPQVGDVKVLPSALDDQPIPQLQDLTIVRLLGSGTFGRVKLVTHKTNGNVYTLKCMSKVQIVDRRQQVNVINERNLLFECSSMFVLTLFATYQSRNELYLLMELIQGGELWGYIYEKKKLLPRTSLGGFKRSACLFYTACVTAALQYIHNKDIAYRDLKPENLMMDGQGFIKVIDFGFAKKMPYMKKGKQMMQTFTLCGTPEYIAPEILLSKGHDKAVDCWALGCLIFELHCGVTPFCHDDQQKIFQAIVHASTNLFFPEKFNPEAQELVRGLLFTNPSKRLGNLKGGLNDIVNSAWLKDFDWEALTSRSIETPYRPKVKDGKDASAIAQIDDAGENVLDYEGSQEIFKDF